MQREGFFLLARVLTEFEARSYRKGRAFSLFLWQAKNERKSESLSDRSVTAYTLEEAFRLQGSDSLGRGSK
jgi:hypothetical protein